MGDPQSVLASVVAVLQLAATATRYLKDIKKGSSERIRLRDELRSTVCLLEMLQDRLEDTNDISYGGSALKPQSISALGSPDGPLHLFKQVLDEIIAELAPQDKSRRLVQPFTWSFDRKEVVELLACLERLKSHFNLVLQNNIVDLTKSANLKLDRISDKVESSEIRSRDADTQKIIHWLSPLSFRARHLSVLESVQPGTGVWLLEHDTFRSWVNSKTGTLWCPGIPGAGKTRLSSLIINHLEKEPPHARSFCSYIYCDYRQRSNQSNVALLSSILQQVLQNSPNEVLPSEVATLYSQHQKYHTRPTLAQITDILGKLVSTFESFHVIVDALDECAESNEEALRFISAVSSLGSSVKILCTSRSCSRFDVYFSKAPRIKISAQKEDIRTFLEACIQEQSRLSKHVMRDPTLKDDIIGTIIQQCQGMFLLAKLHVDSLSKKVSRKEVRYTLKTLPKTLDAMYADAFERMESQDTEYTELAETILFWVVCAKRNFTVQDLQHLYATRELSDGESLEEDDLPDGDILTETCSGLVIVDGESQVVRLVHYTAQQYFEESHKLQMREAKLTLTRCSLRYLALPNFSSGCCKNDAAMSLRLEQYPFLDYAAKYWGSELVHLDGSDVWSYLQRFISKASAVEAANQAWSLKANRYTNWSQEFPRRVPAFVLVSAFEVPELVHYMVSKGYEIDARGSDGETALIRSASLGHAKNVQVLVQLGAEIDARDHMDETALQRAARSGHEDVIKVLLDKGANVNMKASSDWTALMSAVSSGNIKVVKMLVEAGADFGAETVWGDSALSIATRNGQEAIANFLSDRGAILPKGPAGRRASIIASRKGLHQLVRKLTANYDAVADKPLQRQNSRIMQGLTAIQEAEITASDAKTEKTTPPQASRADSGADEFLDALEEANYSTGFSKRYDTIERLGKGHYSEVLLCSNRVTGVRHAVKVCTTNLNRDSDKLKYIILEFKALQSLQKNPHPNILGVIDLFADYTLNTIYMVLELAPCGELFNYIVTRSCLSEEQTRKIFLQLFSAVEFLHGLGWVHRDIKPENILLLEEENPTIKIADFGLAKNIGAGGEASGLTSTLCGTPSYVAPEVLLKDTADRKYGFSVDIWSCGVVMYICMCGFPPFSDELYSKEFPYTLSQQIKEGRFDYPSPYWDNIGDPALDLIDSMLVVDTKKRYTVKQCLEHPWMRETSPQILAEPIRSASPEAM